MSISAPIIYRTFRVDKWDGETNLPRESEPFYQLYLYSGRGDYYGATVNLSSNDVLVEFLVDGLLIASDNLDNLKYFSAWKDYSPRPVPTLMYYDDGNKLLHINPMYPIQFRESIEIRLKANRNSSNRKVYGYRVGLTKEEFQQ